ncbi:hypothetical protein, partial [Aeromonas veronii]|uniref:hypothetical protein n=1 Tax=Aeromonas veronii TaxID=654 RepID=UPI00300533FA
PDEQITPLSADNRARWSQIAISRYLLRMPAGPDEQITPLSADNRVRWSCIFRPIMNTNSDST